MGSAGDSLAVTSGKALFKGINASLVTIVDGTITTTDAVTVGGTLTASGPIALPAGSVTTTMLAANAATSATLQVSGFGAFSSAAVGSWVATTIASGAFTCQGGPIHITVNAAIQHSTTGGATAYVGLMMDGVIQVNIQLVGFAAAGLPVPCGFTWYMTPAAGSHAWTFAWQNNTAGTVSIVAGLNSIAVTEQRR